MTTFLKQIAEDIIENYAVEEFKELLLIVPSRRVGLHLKKEMANQLKQTFWSPQIKSIDEFLTEKHELGVIDSITVQFELYKAYVQLFGNKETFDSFQSWSSQILNDFNEIDRYLLSHKEVFSNLKDIKSEIEKYANDSNLTELQIVERLEKHYFDKKVNENLNLYKKGKKKVSEITKDLKISPRKFYTILEKKKIEHKKYKKSDLKQSV